MIILKYQTAQSPIKCIHLQLYNLNNLYYFLNLNIYRDICIFNLVFSVCIDVSEGTAIFDFTGTGPEVWGNINAPKAVSHSALIYSLRCLVGEDIPLNQGCLNPVKIIIPKKSLLDPSEDAAVVGKKYAPL